jgi:hypothetical protein
MTGVIRRDQTSTGLLAFRLAAGVRSYAILRSAGRWIGSVHWDAGRSRLAGLLISELLACGKAADRSAAAYSALLQRAVGYNDTTK